MSKDLVCIETTSKIGNYENYGLQKCFSICIMQKNHLESLFKQILGMGPDNDVSSKLPGDAAAGLGTTL